MIIRSKILNAISSQITTQLAQIIESPDQEVGVGTMTGQRINLLEKYKKEIALKLALEFKTPI